MSARRRREAVSGYSGSITLPRSLRPSVSPFATCVFLQHPDSGGPLRTLHNRFHGLATRRRTLLRPSNVNGSSERPKPPMREAGANGTANRLHDMIASCWLNYTPDVYDLGIHIWFQCSVNEVDPDAEENRLFSETADNEWEVGHLLRRTVLSMLVLDAVDVISPVITISTDHGQMHLEITAGPPFLRYSEMPAATYPDVLRVPLSAIRRVFNIYAGGCDLVLLHGERYAYKPLIWQGPDDGLASAIGEIAILYSMRQSVNIVPITALVFEDNNPTYVRGYLRPFYPAGSVEAVFERAEGIWCYKPIVAQEIPLDAHMKHRWVKQLAQAVAELHQASHVVTGLCLEHILVDHDNNLKLISSSNPGYNMAWGPPNYFAEDSFKGDIYILGHVIWAICDQKLCHEGMTPPPITWQSKQDCTPLWLRELVSQCTHLDPLQRPNAAAVLEELVTQLGV